MPQFQLGDPQPHRFTIVRRKDIGEGVVVEVAYLDVTTYEGRKILVYESAAAFTTLVTKGLLDPHFLEHNTSPIARFEPTAKGWLLATRFAKNELF